MKPERLPPPLQAHRTALSWLRVSFTAAVAAAVSLRMALQDHNPVFVATTVVLAAVVVLTALAYRDRGRAATLGAPDHHHALPRTALVLSVSVALAGALIVVAMLV